MAGPPGQARRPRVSGAQAKPPAARPRPPPQRDPVQSAYGNSVVSSIVFTEPLVITARPPIATTNKSGPGWAATRPPPSRPPSVTTTIEKPPPPVLRYDTVATTRDAVAEPAPEPPKPQAEKVTEVTFEPDIITARPPPTQAADASSPTGPSDRSASRSGMPSAHAPAAHIGSHGEIVLQPDVIHGRAPDVSPGPTNPLPDQTALGQALTPGSPATSPAGLKDAPDAPAPKPEQVKEGAVVEEEGKEEEEDKPGPVARPDQVAKDGLPTPATVSDQAAKAPQAGGGSSGADGDIAAWRGRVSGAIASTPQPTLANAKEASVTVISGAGRGASARRRAGGAAIGKDAKEAVRKPPEVPKQLPPPPPTPVPAADNLVTAASDKKLPNQTLPTLEQYDKVVPTLPEKDKAVLVPVMDTQFADDIGSKIDVPQPEPKPETVPGDRKPLDAKQVKKVKDAKAKQAETDKKAKPGQALTLTDTAPPPTPGVEIGTKGQSPKKVALVLAELLSSPVKEAETMVTDARKEAYPQAALDREFPGIGADKKNEVYHELKNQIDQLRVIAGITAAQLDEAIKTRAEQLEKAKAGAKDAFELAKEQAKEETKKSGEEEAEKIAGARAAIDEDTIQKMVAATGEADPEVIKLRRDKGLRDLARRAARQDIYYEKSGERRAKALDASQTRMRNAYQNSVKGAIGKIVAFKLEEAKKARKGAKKGTKEEQLKLEKDEAETAKKEADKDTLQLAQWTAQRTMALERRFRELKDEAAKATKELRSGIKTALDNARDMLREWAEQKIVEQESWWDSLIRRFREWRQDAENDASAWEEARNEALRNSLVGDMQMLDDIQAAAQTGVDMNAHIQERGLDQAQATVLQTYFGGDKNAPRDAIGAVAAGMRMRVRTAKKPGVIEYMKGELMRKGDEEWRRLGNVGNAERPPFNVVALGSDLHAAMDQWGTDEGKIYGALANLTPVQARAIRAFYQTRYHRSLDEHLKDEMDDAELGRAQALLEGNQTLADVETLREAMDGPGTDEDAIMQVLRNKSAEERAAIVAEYKKKYGVDLNAELKSELDDGWSSHHDFERAGALMDGNTAKADAIAADQAMHGGITGAGTDEGAINKIYEQTRSEVEAEAARKGWSTQELEAEITRRNKAIEDEYEARYGNVEERKRTGGPSALSKAYKSELSGAELDLANALHNNDIVAADAARIGVEKEAFITSDETVNKVLESQYSRARKNLERDKNLDLRFRAEVDSLQGNPWNNQRWVKERENARHEIDQQSKEQAKLNMSKLETAFDEKYSKFGKGGLQVLIAFNMSGEDQDKAWNLIKQGGYLEPAQEIFYAVNGAGTDEEALKRILKGKSPDEVAAIRKRWKELYPNEPDLDSRIREEVGGRDSQDMKWALEGEPQTLDGKIKRKEEQLNYEKTAYSFGNSFSDEERTFMEEEYKELVNQKEKFEKLSLSMPPKRPDESNEMYVARMMDDTDALRAPQKKGESDDDYAARLATAANQSKLLDDYSYSKETLNLQESYFDRSVEDHRAAVDSLADTVANVAAIVATIVVIAVASFFTAGTGGAAIIAALASAKVAAAAALAAAAATIASKQLLKGSAYSGQEMGVDAIVGVVDAIASFATAGVGGGLLKSIRAGAPASKLATMAANTKVASKLAKAAASESLVTRVFANAAAEGMEGLASTLPSALVGNVLDEKNWAKGNPLANILGGTLVQTGIGVGLSGGLGGLGGIGKHVDDVAGALPGTRKDLAAGLAENSDVLAKRGDPADRLAAWKGWQIENPGKPYKEFIDEFDAGIVAKEADDTARQALQREMRGELLSGIPPAQRGQFADVPIHVMSDADFQRFTKSTTGQAVVIFENGKPRVILREGSDIKALREEGIHLVQSKDPKFGKKFAKLDETQLANWKNLDLDEQLDLYRTKIDIELDAQQRLLKSLDEELAGIDDPALRKSLLDRREAAVKNFENLKNRLDEVTGIGPADKMKIARGELDPPQYLDQEPRLFSKTRADEQAAIANVPAGKQVPTRRLVSKLGADADQKNLTSLLGAASAYDSRAAALAAKSGSAGGIVGSLRARVYLFVSELITMAKWRAILLQKSSMKFYEAASATVLAPFLFSAPSIYKSYAKAMATVEKSLFGNLEKIASSGTFRRSRLTKLAAAMDQILDSTSGKKKDRIGLADEFIKDVREAVEEWNNLQKHLEGVKAGRNVDPGDLIRQKHEADLAAKIAKLDGYPIADSKLLGDIKAEIKFEGKWRWATFRETMGEDFADPSTLGFLEAIITKSTHWDAADIGPIRRWASVMEQLHGSLSGPGAGPNLAAFFDDLAKDGGAFVTFFKGKNLPVGSPQARFESALDVMLAQFDAGYKQGRYDQLRYFLRDAVVAAAMDCPDPKAQFTFMKAFLDHLRAAKGDHNASVGEFFAAFQRRKFNGVPPIQGDLAGTTLRKDAGVQIEGSQKMLDGVFDIPDGVKIAGMPDGPKRVGAEFKAGESFDPEQLKNYHEKLESGTLKTSEGTELDGVLYIAETPAHAKFIRDFLDNKKYNAAINVVVMEEGIYRIVPRKKPALSPPPV